MEDVKATILKGTIIKEVSTNHRYMFVGDTEQGMRFQQINDDPNFNMSMYLSAINTEKYILERPIFKMEIFTAYGTLTKGFDVLFGIYNYENVEADPVVFGRQLALNPVVSEIYGFIATPKLAPRVDLFLTHNNMSAENYIQDEIALYPDTISTEIVCRLVGKKFDDTFKIIRKENKGNKITQKSLEEFLTVHGFDKMVNPLVEGYDIISENNKMSEPQN